jgi:hypothetical protein
MRTRTRTSLIVLTLLEATLSSFVVTFILYFVLLNKSLPTPIGNARALSGPFEALGIEGLIVAGLIFVTVSALKFLAAYWLWKARKDGAVLQLILLSLSLIFWYGFALPYGILFGLPQFILAALVWKELQ